MSEPQDTNENQTNDLPNQTVDEKSQDANAQPSPNPSSNESQGSNEQPDSNEQESEEQEQEEQPSSSGGMARKVAGKVTGFGANKAKQAIANSDTEVGTLMRLYTKTKSAVLKTKKYTGWLIKYIQFCVSSPVGWVCGILTIVLLGTWIADFKGSMDDALKDLQEISIDGQTDDHVVTILTADCKSPESSSGNSGSTSSDEASGADWTKEGTVAWKNAKDIFDAWVEVGLSGEAAAGIIGWIETEGGTAIIGRAEGHYGSKIEENSIKYGVVPIPSLSHYSVGGGGIYQFTPYTKYRKLSDPDWEDGKAMTQYVIGLMPNDWIPSADKTGGNHTFEQFAQHTNPEEAALMWNAYERGHDGTISKILHIKRRDAKIANDLFNKDGIKFDRAKFDKQFKTGGSSTPGSSGDNASGNPNKKRCGKTSSGSNGWSKDGEGTHHYHNGTGWKPSNLPADLKQYALDPTSVGLTYGESTGWHALPSSLNNQCTDLAASLMYALWEKDGQHPKQLRGNGGAVAKNWSATFGGNTTKTPTSGAVFSTGVGTDASPGHTGVVSHVFADGSMLVVEQNCPGLSGQGNGTTFTWNYRIISKDAISQQQYSFYLPGDNGWKVVSSAKAMS